MLEMMPHIKQMNQQVRIDRVIALINEICVSNPLRIDISKITKPIHTIDLSWVLAFCQKACNSVAEVDFKDLVLNALQKNILEQLNTKSGIENLLQATRQAWLDEVYLGNGLTVIKTHSYELSPAAVISLVLKHFNHTSCAQLKTDLLKKTKYKEGLIAEIMVNEILPVVLDGNKKTKLKKGQVWQCFLMLEAALKNHGATQVVIRGGHNSKLKSSISFTRLWPIKPPAPADLSTHSLTPA